MADSQWMSIVEYARTFNVSDMTVRRRIKTGRLEAVLREGKYYIPAEGRASRVEVDEPRPRAKPIQREHRPQPRYADRPQPSYVTETRIPAQIQRPRVEYQQHQDSAEPRTQVEQSHRISDLHRMIDVCESAVKSFANLETKLEENYRSKVQILEGKILSKDREIEQLHQKVEDLQLLVSILEKRRS